MKILKLSAYYAPERISSSHLCADLEEAYLKAGFEMEVYAPTPTRGISKEVRGKYKKIKHEELFDGKIVVHRFSIFKEGKNPVLRALRYLLVNLKHYFNASKAKDADVIISGSTPPTQGLLCAKLSKKLSKKKGRHVPFIYALHDVFPDSLVTTGLSKKGSLLWRIGRKMENYTYKNADHIIAVSEQIKANIMEKGVPEEKITVISHWIDTDSVKPVSKAENKLFDEFKIDRDKFTVVYAGNFGFAQGADVIIKAAELLRERENIQFMIFGGGAEFENAKKEVHAKALENVIINPILPQDRVPEVYSLGDVSLISCKKGVGESSMPSKVYSIMACNTPIIASFDTESELADILQRSGAGICVEPEDPRALADAIMKASQGDAFYNNNGRKYVCENASKEICVTKYVNVIKNVLNA